MLIFCLKKIQILYLKKIYYVKSNSHIFIIIYSQKYFYNFIIIQKFFIKIITSL